MLHLCKYLHKCKCTKAKGYVFCPECNKMYLKAHTYPFAKISDRYYPRYQGRQGRLPQKEKLKNIAYARVATDGTCRITHI